MRYDIEALAAIERTRKGKVRKADCSAVYTVKGSQIHSIASQ